MNSLGKARFLLEPPKGSSDRFEGGRKELVILEEGAPFGLSQRLLLLQSPPQVTVVDSKNHPPYKHTYTNNKPLTCFSWSSTAWGHFGMTAQQEAGLEVLKRHIPGRKRERSQIASCFPLAFSSPLPTGFGACQTPAVPRSHLLRPALSCLCISAVLHHPMYKTEADWYFSQDFREVWLHYLMSYSDRFIVRGWAISRFKVQSVLNENNTFLHIRKKNIQMNSIVWWFHCVMKCCAGLGCGYSFHGPLDRMHLYLPLVDSMLISVTQ